MGSGGHVPVDGHSRWPSRNQRERPGEPNTGGTRWSPGAAARARCVARGGVAEAADRQSRFLPSRRLAPHVRHADKSFSLGSRAQARRRFIVERIWPPGLRVQRGASEVVGPRLHTSVRIRLYITAVLHLGHTAAMLRFTRGNDFATSAARPTMTGRPINTSDGHSCSAIRTFHTPCYALFVVFISCLPQASRRDHRQGEGSLWRTLALRPERGWCMAGFWTRRGRLRAARLP